MTAHAVSTRRSTPLLPAAGPAPGEALWGEEPARQPIAPLVLMAIILLLVAAPTALGGSGTTANPITLMRDVATSTYDLALQMGEANESLISIDENSRQLINIQGSMGDIAQATGNMETKTTKLNEQLATVGSAMSRSRATLARVDGKLATTGAGMGALRTNVAGSVRSTKTMVGEFRRIDAAIGTMDTQLTGAITKMAASGPLTKAFANNTTRKQVAGGSSKKYGVPNIAEQSRVMSVVLPMINVMQNGGALPARKDKHVASNPIVGTALSMQVPDGTNVVAIVRPFDGFYGVPGTTFFQQNRIHGF